MKRHLKYAIGAAGPCFTTTATTSTGAGSIDTATDANKTLNSSASFW
jgi:3-oxoacyl-(acyl-carrier-protein) synthase